MVNRSEEKLENIDVVILCGGKGTRLRSVISDKPKVMAPLGSSILLDLLLDKLAASGFKKIILATGYLQEQIKEHVKGYKTEIIISEEDKPLGTGGAVKNALPLISTANFLVMNGDSLCDISYDKLKEFHRYNKALVSMVLSSIINKDAGAVYLDQDKRITSFKEKQVNNQTVYMNAGIYLMNKQIAGLLPKEDYFSLEYDFFPKIVELKKIYGFPIDTEVLDIGTPERYNLAKKKYN